MLRKELRHLCECGCNEEVAFDKRFKKGHNSRKMSMETKEKISVAMKRAYKDSSLGLRHSVIMKKLWGTDAFRLVRRECKVTSISKVGRVVSEKKFQKQIGTLHNIGRNLLGIVGSTVSYIKLLLRIRLPENKVK